ncbi:MAG: thioredoxin family protein [Candidatus Omnitrophica bacterium]|nr:thioredoxin family protein [Candidatus Omnitrophota bacterium]
MVLLESILVKLGSPMPPFTLKDPNGKSYTGEELFGERGLLVIFTCNHCPYAIAVWPRLIRLAKYAKAMKINTVAINPNINPAYPDDAPDKMIEKIKELGIEFPYLVDETQQTAKAFKAQCTPDIFLFNKDKKLAYHGRIDDNWQDESKVTREELKEAMNNMATGQPLDAVQRPTMGCSIKWNN